MKSFKSMNVLWALLVVCATIVAAAGLLAQTSSPQKGGESTVQSAESKAELEKEIQAAGALFTAAKSHLVGAAPPAGSVTASFVPLDICGNTYKPADVVQKGIRFVITGTASVVGGAPSGDYKFFTFLKITDNATGKVIKQEPSMTLLKKSDGQDLSTDFGYIGLIQNCYCDATELQLEASVSSIGPKGDFVIHQYQTCTFWIKP